MYREVVETIDGKATLHAKDNRGPLMTNAASTPQRSVSLGYPDESGMELQYPSQREDIEPREEDISHFYNVLWIERRGDVAYRRALGRVEQHVWDANCTVPQSIVLG